MGIGEIFKVIGEKIVFVIQYLLSKSFFYTFSYLAFLTVLVQAFTKALAEVTPEPYPAYAFKIALKTIINVALHISTIDNQLYVMSKEYLALKTPFFFQTITFFYKMAMDLFFYYWWYRLFEWVFTNAGQTIGTGLDQSAGKIDVFRKVIVFYIIYFTIMNFIGLVATKQITLDIPDLPLPQKIKYFTETNFTSAFDFLTKIFPFKGLAHFTFYSFGTILGNLKTSYFPKPEIVEVIP